VLKRVPVTGQGSASGGGDQYETDYYFHNAGWQVLETRRTDQLSASPDNLQPRYQYVWSARYIDSPILRDKNTDTDYLCDDERLYYLTDANFNVTTLVNTAGGAIERYLYDPYGKVTIYDGTWTSTRSSSSYDNTILYTGREYDPETGLYHYRNRPYTVDLARFLSRDPIGHEGSENNLYQYGRNGAATFVDPMGLHRDFNPNGPRIGLLPAGAQVTDASNWLAFSFHHHLWAHYAFRDPSNLPDGSSADYVILGGAFLEDVRGQSGMLSMSRGVRDLLHRNAITMLQQGLGCGQQDTFVNRGSQGIASDVMSTNVILSLGRFTVFWEAGCTVSKQCHVPLAECDDKCGSMAIWTCNVSWALHDYYDFEWWMPQAYLGSPFHIRAYWKGFAGGSRMSCDDE